MHSKVDGRQSANTVARGSLAQEWAQQDLVHSATDGLTCKDSLIYPSFASLPDFHPLKS